MNLNDAELGALASLSDAEATELFARKDSTQAIKKRVREIVAAQEAKKARESSSDDAQSRRDEREPAGDAGRTAAASPATQEAPRSAAVVRGELRLATASVDELTTELARVEAREDAAQAKPGDKRQADPASHRKAQREDDTSTALAGTYQGTQEFFTGPASPASSVVGDDEMTSPGVVEPDADMVPRYERQALIKLAQDQKVPEVWSEAELDAVIEAYPVEIWQALAKLMTVPAP